MAKKKKRLKIAKHRGKKSAPRNSRGLFALQLGAGMVIIAAAVLSYFTLAHASLAPVSAGMVSIDSAASQQTLARQISEAATGYRVTLQYSDNSKQSFALGEIGVSIDSAASAKNIKNYLNSHVEQRLAWWQPIDIQLVTKTDKARLDYFVGNKATMVTTPAVNANLTATGGKAAIIPEVFGSGSAVRNAKQAILNSAASLSSQPLVLSPQQFPPEIKASDLEPAKLKLTQLLNQRISFAVGQNTIVASANDIADWVELTPVIQDKTVDITVNSGKVEQYIEAITSKYTEPPRSRVVMQSPAGETVLDPGSAGLDITKKDEMAATVAAAAQKGEGYAAALPITHLSAKTVRVPAADKVLVVDTTTKRMYAYQNAALVKTILVSAGAPKTPTVMGQYAIYSKYVKQDMRGANADGSRYFQADVPYVNYFHKDYAIHGNFWRSKSYFGNINSSHGCVGIVPADGAWVYDWALIGTPVIVHD